MPVTVRVGAIHLGWDVVSVAAGGGGMPIRPVQVEGSYTTPAYLLADSSGRLHTAGVDRRPDLGLAISDVRDILGHAQIIVAGATWPAELVFRARLYNPLAAVGAYLRGKPDLLALPYPDGWPDEKVDLYCALVEQLGVAVEPIPESIALSGYMRALGLVRAPDRQVPNGIGATGVYSDGRTVLVVAVHGDDEQPTASMELELDPDAARETRVADDTVIEVMAAARQIGADTSSVLFAGNASGNERLKFAFRNHLGQRFHAADHPIHALVLGATHLLLSENAAEPSSNGRHAEPEPPRYPGPPSPAPMTRPPAPPQGTAPPAPPGAPGPYPSGVGPQYHAPGPVPPHAGPPAQQGPEPGRPPIGPGGYSPRPPAGPEAASGDDMTVRTSFMDASAGRPPHTGERGEDPRGHAGSTADEQSQHGGKIWGKMKDNLFGAHTVVGAVALAVMALPSQGVFVAPTGVHTELGSAVVEPDRVVSPGITPAGCSLAPRVMIDPRDDTAAGGDIVTTDREGPAEFGPAADDTERSAHQAARPDATAARDGAAQGCREAEIDNLRYLIPGPPGAVDPGPPIDI
ncbi:hypothetical protein [Nocardia brevicatena]|uniref:hypothetical protein n=1 Tax=Nocardia brevicatena TaxID=37327 RepID=UPI000592EA28|nr:hypothetical protein [Nocardia brevicatena]